MQSFIVHIEVRDRSELPATWEQDLRDAVDRADGREFRIAAGTPWPLLALSFVLDVENEKQAESAGHDIVRAVFGGKFSWGVVGVSPLDVGAPTFRARPR